MGLSITLAYSLLFAHLIMDRFCVGYVLRKSDDFTASCTYMYKLLYLSHNHILMEVVLVRVALASASQSLGCGPTVHSCGACMEWYTSQQHGYLQQERPLARSMAVRMYVRIHMH